MPRTPLLISASLCLFIQASQALERELYFTDFETATAGPDQLVGYDGWNGNSIGTGSHGIDPSASQGLGKSAFVGFGIPDASATSVTVLHSFTHDPVASGEPFVRLVAAVGINDSDNSPSPGSQPPRDNFFITFFNQAGQALASLNYNNTEAGFGLWRDDGLAAHDSGEEFIRGEVQLLVAEIDFANNAWSVELDGFPVFRDAPFTAKTGVAMGLGGTAIVWQRAGDAWGNNWMLFDDWTVNVDDTKLIIPATTFEVGAVARDPSGRAQITWRVQPGFNYQLEYSADLAAWHADLPASLISNTNERNVTYTDEASAGQASRYYRVKRSRAP